MCGMTHSFVVIVWGGHAGAGGASVMDGGDSVMDGEQHQ